MSSHCPVCRTRVSAREHLRASRTSPIRCHGCPTLLATRPPRAALALAATVETIVIMGSVLAMFAWGWWTVLAGCVLAVMVRASLLLCSPIRVVQAREVRRARRVQAFGVGVLLLVLVSLTILHL